jgi:uncharacterized protein with von Willebrand factor type A (vWA) domain
MSSWIRRSFTSIGLTQVPAGPHLDALCSRFGGVVMLMIDVSGSMHGRPILEAVSGAQTFIDEAVDAYYQVGVMLWNTVVVACAEPTADGEAARALLRPVTSASGGNALDGPLIRCHQILAPSTGDRVVALFGDGDLTPKHEVLRKVAEMKADNIRFVTRGLGASAAHEFAQISDEEPETVAVDSVEDLADGIAGMARSLRSSGLTAL